MNFGEAIELANAGHRIQRAGWCGKDMWVLCSPDCEALPADSFWPGLNRDYALANGGTAKPLPAFTIKTATGEILIGWLASQTDMLADDWQDLAPFSEKKR
jgi:hypothetical protein